MLALARRSLASFVATGLLPDVAEGEVPPILRRTGACFVTLTKEGALRGCVGNVQAREPLYRAILVNAQNAAARDPRFPPLAPDELGLVRLEISVLTEPQPLVFVSADDLLGKLQPHRDGVVLRIGLKMATFLPQVWEHLPRKDDFLGHLSVKAGCEASAWRGPDASVSVYQVECFEEPKPPAGHI